MSSNFTFNYNGGDISFPSSNNSQREATKSLLDRV